MKNHRCEWGETDLPFWRHLDLEIFCFGHLQWNLKRRPYCAYQVHILHRHTQGKEGI